MEIIERILERYGFPVMVCVWFMWREKRLSAMTKQIAKLTTAVVRLSQALSQRELDVPDNTAELQLEGSSDD